MLTSLLPPHLSSSLTDSLPSLNLLCHSKTDATMSKLSVSPSGEQTFIFAVHIKELILWIELPWPEKPPNTYAQYTGTLDSCFDLIGSHQQSIPCVTIYSIKTWNHIIVYWYNLNHILEHKSVDTFPKGIGPKVNFIAWPEFRLAYYDITVQHFPHDAVENENGKCM